MHKTSGEDQWYVLIDEQKYGPIRFSQLEEFAGQGRLLQGDWIWKPGLSSWIAARELADLFTSARHLRSESAQIDRGVGEKSEKREPKGNFKERAKSQIENFALMFFYLWVVFGLLAIHESMVLSQHNINYQFHGLAVVNALIFAKVMLIAEDLHLGNRLNDKPLIYSILFKSVLFGVTLICFHILEHVLIGLWQDKPIAETISEIGADRLGEIVSAGIISAVALVPFFILREISRVIGEDKFWSLFIRRRNS
jgi:hypothetical protein